MFGQAFRLKLVAIILAAGAALIFIFSHGLSAPTQQEKVPLEKLQTETADLEPKVVSTKPDPLDNSTILPAQAFEITFNLPIQDPGEFKNKVEPKVGYSIKLSPDKKTAIVTPNTTFDLGTGYTIFILGETKFDNKKTLGKELIYHFKTIRYKGV